MTTTITARIARLHTLIRTALALAVLVAAGLASSTAAAATLGAFIYGIDDNSDIYEINPADQTWEKVYSSARASTTTNLDGPDSLAG